MVGTNTAVADNPMLNTRLWKGSNPVRIVLDQNLRIPKDSHLFDGSIKTIVLCGKPPSEKPFKNAIFETLSFQENLVDQICEVLYKHEIQSVIIEGGRRTLQTFIESGKWDEARVFTGNIEFQEGTEAPEISGNLVSKNAISSDNLKIYKHD